MVRIALTPEDAAIVAAGPKRRRGVVLANGPTVQGVAEYRAFEWPKGTGRTWRIDPVSYRTGAELAELEIEQMQIADEITAERTRADGAPLDRALVAELTRRWVDWGARAAELLGPLMIPTWPFRSKWGYRLLRRLGWLRLRRNPLRDAPQNDLAELLGFFSLCRTTSGGGIRPVAGNSG